MTEFTSEVANATIKRELNCYKIQAGSAGLREEKSACKASESANKPQYKAAKFGGQAGAVSADESGVTKSVENESKKTRVGLPSIRKANGIMTVLPRGIVRCERTIFVGNASIGRWGQENRTV